MAERQRKNKKILIKNFSGLKDKWTCLCHTMETRVETKSCQELHFSDWVQLFHFPHFLRGLCFLFDNLVIEKNFHLTVKKCWPSILQICRLSIEKYLCRQFSSSSAYKYFSLKVCICTSSPFSWLRLCDMRVWRPNLNR